MYRSSTTLEDVVRLVLPQKTRVLVGEESLGRAVSWACSLRPSPPAFPKLDGDELALIDLDDLRRLDNKMRLDRVVHSLQSAHITAIAVLGPVNETAIQAARSHRIALLQIPDGDAVVQIERDIIRLIVDRDGYIAQRSADLQRTLNQTALDGGGLDRIADNIHSFAQQPVVILREDGEIAAESGLADLADSRHQAIVSALPNITVLRTWAATQMNNEHDQVADVLILSEEASGGTSGRRLLGTPLSPREVVISSVIANEKVRGYCLLIRSHSDEGADVRPIEATAASQGAAAVALEWAKQNAVDVAEERMRTAFVDELLASEIADEEAWIQRGGSLGYDMQRPHAAWMLYANNIVDWPGPLTRFLNEMSVNTPMCNRDDGLLLFWPLDNPTSARELKVIAGDLLEQATGQTSKAELLIGIGRPGVGPSEWHRSQQQARESCRLGREWNGTAVTYFGDLAFYQLLTGLRGSQEADRFYRRTLGRLLAHDEAHNAELVSTLNAFFSCHGNLSQTATSLHIHRNTLTYRLDRISEITRLDLNDPDARFSLQLAIKLQPLM